MSIQSQGLQDKLLPLTDRLTLIEELIEELTPQCALKVVVNDDPMVVHQALSQGNVVYTYELIGSKSLRKTQNNNLLQKLQTMEKNQLEQKPRKNSKELSLTTNFDQQPSQQKDTPKPSEDNEKTIYRYFTQNIKCFRCKKTGHHDYACLDEFSCNYCLSSQHHSQRCPQKVVCFRCYQSGHMVSDCTFREDGPFCHNCKRKHFQKCGFLMRGTEQVKQLFLMDSLYFNEDIRCLKCFKYGHFNCEINEGTTGHFKRPYQNMGDRTERRQSREKFHHLNKKYKY